MTFPKNYLLTSGSSCTGNGSCGLCEKEFPGFLSDHNGCVHISDWAIRQNNDQIDKMIMMCPEGCIELTEM